MQRKVNSTVVLILGLTLLVALFVGITASGIASTEKPVTETAVATEGNSELENAAIIIAVFILAAVALAKFADNLRKFSAGSYPSPKNIHGGMNMDIISNENVLKTFDSCVREYNRGYRPTSKFRPMILPLRNAIAAGEVQFKLNDNRELQFEFTTENAEKLFNNGLEAPFVLGMLFMELQKQLRT